MIDTDKYEGHTPAEEWGGKDKIIFADGYRAIFLDDDVYATDLDRRLMAAATLLLAEVERLRKELDEVYKERDKYDGALNIALEHLGYQGADHEWFCREKYQCNVYGDDLEEEE